MEEGNKVSLINLFSARFDVKNSEAIFPLNAACEAAAFMLFKVLKFYKAKG